MAMTQKQLFEELLGLSQVQAKPELVEGLQTRLQALEQKRASSKASGPSKAELELRAQLAQQSLEVLAQSETPMKTSELANQLGVTTQKLTPVLATLVEQQKVVVVLEKRVKFFTLPKAE